MNKSDSKSKTLFDYPELMKQWNYEKNQDLSPESASIGSNKKIWWICEKHHEWAATVYNRSKGVGCPYCSNHKAWAG